MKVVEIYLVQNNHPMGFYYSKIEDIDGKSLFPDADDTDVRMVYTLELVDMDEEEFNRLKEFAGF